MAWYGCTQFMILVLNLVADFASVLDGSSLNQVVHPLNKQVSYMPYLLFI